MTTTKNDRYPPELESLVLLQCDKVDDNGVWGSLWEWQGFEHNAYLPIGSVLCHRGRGQRREQAAFLQRARRQASKNRPLQIVARVEGVQAVSRTSVVVAAAPPSAASSLSSMTDVFQITLARQGISPHEEAAARKRSREVQHCADLMVDRAARNSGVDCRWARRVALYEPYHRALRRVCSAAAATKDRAVEGDIDGDSDEGDDGDDPMRAALRLLIDDIGAFPEDDADKAVEFACDKLLASCGTEILQEVDTQRRRAFVQDLVSRCQNEQKRLSKPVTYSLSVALGGIDAIAAELRKTTAPSAVAGASSVGAVEAALRSLEGLEAPPECSPLSIAVQGAAKFCFSTQCAESAKSVAEAYLKSAKAKASAQWANSAAQKEPPTSQDTIEGTNHPGTRDPAENLQPNLTIGLIGDVANGKSTLIQAMSGKRTQAHSSEQQKHGMTIRLGFANAAVLRCCDHEACGSYAFASESESLKTSSLPVCKSCGGNIAVVRRVSFTDCPGHQELMATMLTGASSFDAVILAAAATSSCPTPQAKQHLDALERSRSRIAGRIAVAQTKAELLIKTAARNDHGLSAQALLSLHATRAKESLQGTVAEGAPFFPICAPLKLGLEPLAKWIACLPANRQSQSSAEAPRIFNVLRSFDVNHPGKFTGLSGGVLGGTVSYSGLFRPGDELEVRPGLCPGYQVQNESNPGDEGSPPFAVLPLECRCVAVMTGTSRIPQASSGGLVALQTLLSPSLCADDRLVGTVVGPKGSLPPVWGPTLYLDEMNFIAGDPVVFQGIRPSQRLPKGGRIRCHVGSSSVAGRVHRLSAKRGKLELRLERPLCAFKDSNMVIETEVPGRSGFYLVAHASLFGGSLSLEGAEAPAEEDEPRLESVERTGDVDDPDEMNLNRFLDELASREAESSSEGLRVSVCKAQVKRDGGAHVVVENFAAIAACLNRDPAHLVSYLEHEAALSCVRCGESGGSLRVRTRNRGFGELLQKIIHKYAATFVCCQQCKSARTELFKRTSNVELVCRQCNARRFVPKV